MDSLPPELAVSFLKMALLDGYSVQPFLDKPIDQPLLFLPLITFPFNFDSITNMITIF